VTALALRRLGAAGLTVAAALTLTFLLAHLAPGEPMLGEAEHRGADPAAVERVRRRFGLDQPLPVQFARYVGGALRGDLGESFVRRRSVAGLIGERLPNTLLLGGCALLLSFALGIPLAAMQARSAGSWTDGGLGALALLFYSMPSFWLGLVLLIVFGQWLGWMPTGGLTTPVAFATMGPLARAADVLAHLVLPAATLALVQIAVVSRIQRGAIVDALGEPFVRAARSRGLSERRVLVRHALRASLAPALTLAGTSLPALLAGSVLVETVFGWPGMGRLTYDAVQARDYNVLFGCVLTASALVALGTLAADLATAALDPRQRR